MPSPFPRRFCRFLSLSPLRSLKNIFRGIVFAAALNTCFANEQIVLKIDGFNQDLTFTGRVDNSLVNCQFAWTREKGLFVLGVYDVAWQVRMAGNTSAIVPTAPMDFGLNKNLNRNGKIVGRRMGPDGVMHAFSWKNGKCDSEIFASLGAGYSEAISVNEQGDVIGEFYTKSGRRCGFFWSEATGVIVIDGDGEGASVDILNPLLVGINDRGHVIGNSQSPRGELQGFFWSKESGIVEINDSGEDERYEAIAINNRGQIVGIKGEHISKKLFIWESGKGIQVVNVLADIGDFDIVAFNDNGDIVVNVSYWQQSRGFLWKANEGLVDIGNLGWKEVEIVGLNNQGEIIGNGRNKKGLRRGFFWSKDSGIIEIGALGGGSSEAIALNEAGQVVGNSRIQAEQEFRENKEGTRRAFFWSKDSGVIEISALGGDGSEGLAINENGQVLGLKLNGQGKTGFFIWSREADLISIDFVPQLQELRRIFGEIRLNNLIDVLSNLRKPPADK